jgi:hypothetical protein
LLAKQQVELWLISEEQQDDPGTGTGSTDPGG